MFPGGTNRLIDLFPLLGISLCFHSASLSVIIPVIVIAHFSRFCKSFFEKVQIFPGFNFLQQETLSAGYRKSPHLKEEPALKRGLSLLLASLMLVFALTACGRRDETPQSNNQNQNDSAVVGGESADHGNTSNTVPNDPPTTNDRTDENNSLLDDAGNAVEDGLDGMKNAVDDMSGGAAGSRARTDNNIYNQRLNSTGTLTQNGNPVTFQNLVLPGIF
jgi:hypothetical protein